MVFGIKNLKMLQHGRGVAWTAPILKDGKLVGECSNEGTGGCNRYSFEDKSVNQEFNKAARAAHPNELEPEDAYMEDLIRLLESKESSRG